MSTWPNVSSWLEADIHPHSDLRPLYPRKRTSGRWSLHVTTVTRISEQDTADDARAYHLRALLNQLLKRLVAELRFHPGDGPRRLGRKVEVQLRGAVMTFDAETGDAEQSDGYILEMM